MNKNYVMVMIEKTSVLFLLWILLVLCHQHYTNKVTWMTYLWHSVLISLPLIHCYSIKYRATGTRMFTNWCIALIWTWLAFTSLNNTWIHIPALFIGTFHIIAALKSLEKIEIDWE